MASNIYKLTPAVLFAYSMIVAAQQPSLPGKPIASSSSAVAGSTSPRENLLEEHKMPMRMDSNGMAPMQSLSQSSSPAQIAASGTGSNPSRQPGANSAASYAQSSASKPSASSAYAGGKSKTLYSAGNTAVKPRSGASGSLAQSSSLRTQFSLAAKAKGVTIGNSFSSGSHSSMEMGSIASQLGLASGVPGSSRFAPSGEKKFGQDRFAQPTGAFHPSSGKGRYE